jgi:DNA-binding transcriptional ArsR family regulator
MVEHLARGPCSIGMLSEPFDMSPPAISKHLRVLERSGLITRTKVGRITYCRLTRTAFAESKRWLAEHEAFWEQQFDALDDYLKEDQWPPWPQPPAVSRSDSRAASPRRANASSMHGRRQKR